ncbi:MAG: bifunctional folylpolyglutamate synthase/dihydrofolate synthase, partial [Rhodospirillales bacterium]
MSPVRELDAALERLFRRNLHTIKLDLAPMRDLMAWLGNPQDGLLFVHVAGTNGKGSVCTMLAAMLRAQGYRTGLYTSPHLVRFNERIQINGDAISDERLQDLIDEVEQAAKKLRSYGQRDVTFFEFTTALAMLYFAREKTDIVVLETGMGGRLDATNIIVPALSIITSIGFDHMA